MTKSISRWIWAAAFLCTCVGATALQAQGIRIHGEALDRITHLPVRGVVIQISALGLITVSDSTGYFAFEGVSEGNHVVTAFHLAYITLSEETDLAKGDVLVVNLTPQVLTVEGLEVAIPGPEVREERTSGTVYDLISTETVEELRDRQSRMVEVLRQKAPPRLKIRQGGTGNGAGVNFCISSTRRTASVQELRDSGGGCHPTMIVVDGVILYAPTTGAGLPNYIPQEVTNMVLTLNPEEVESVRLLGRTDAFFRYGDSGRLGALLITTRKPGR